MSDNKLLFRKQKHLTSMETVEHVPRRAYAVTGNISIMSQ